MIIKSKTISNGYPEWVLDTAKRTVTNFERDTGKKNVTDFHTDYVKDHLRYVASKHPERLQKLVDEGKIIGYLDGLETRAIKAVDRQIEKWKISDKEYQAAIIAEDTLKAVRLVNCLQSMAREIVYDTIIYA
ncbi:MAG: TnpV protein [Ruminococcus sp.]|nr:TnpV protein [Ruminococcus sp.]